MERLETGDLVRYANGGTALTGTYIAERDGMVVVKLESGYNIGTSLEKIEFVERPARQPPAGAGVVVQNTDLPELAIISTGGTIASDPAGGLRNPKQARRLPRPLRVEEVVRLLDSIPTAGVSGDRRSVDMVRR